MAEETPRKPVVEHWKSLANPIEADTLRQESINARHDHLITEIETSDGPLATTLRSVYEGDELFKFEDRLNDRIKSHDKEIERMCNYHYQGFIDSVRELQLVSGDAAKLQGDIQGINADLQESCAPLTGKGEELIRCRRMQKNIAAAIENLSLCLPVLEMYGKLQDQMKSKRYYPALKTLEQLEHTYLPRVMSHWFSQTMAEAIPLLREKIKAASMMDLKDFLENIRKHLVRIGEVAMLHAAEQSNIDPAVAKRKRKRKVAPPPPNPFTGEVEMPPDLLQEIDDDDEERSAQDMVDFSPVYRCLHIYTVLGDKENFETYYRKQRWSQARLSLKPSPNMHESIDCYQQYFHDIVGSFVIEDHILSTTQGLVNRAFMDEMWEMAVVKIVAALKASIVKCTEADLLLKIKKLVVLFCHTLKGYGFTVGQLLEFLLIEMRDRYNSLLTEQWIDVFNEIFNEDNYTPIFIANEADYQSVITQFPFRSKELERAPFPKKFPYSQFVPNIYNQVKEFINACLKFSADLHLSNTEIDDMIRKSANLFLTETLSDCLSSLMKRPNLSLLQLTQIVINMNYLEKSCGYLEEHISTITGAETDSVHATRLQGISMFKVRCGSIYVAAGESADQVTSNILTALINSERKRRKQQAKYSIALGTSYGHVHTFFEENDSVLRVYEKSLFEEKCLMLIKKPRESTQQMLKAQSLANISTSDTQLYKHLGGYATYSDGKKNKPKMHKRQSSHAVSTNTNGTESDTDNSFDKNTSKKTTRYAAFKNKLVKHLPRYSSCNDVSKLSYTDKTKTYQRVSGRIGNDELYGDSHGVCRSEVDGHRSQSVGDLSTGFTVSLVGQKNGMMPSNLKHQNSQSMQNISSFETKDKVETKQKNPRDCFVIKEIDIHEASISPEYHPVGNSCNKSPSSDVSSIVSSSSTATATSDCKLKSRRSLPKLPPGDVDEKRRKMAEIMKSRISVNSHKSSSSMSKRSSTPRGSESVASGNKYETISDHEISGFLNQSDIDSYTSKSDYDMAIFNNSNCKNDHSIMIDSSCNQVNNSNCSVTFNDDWISKHDSHHIQGTSHSRSTMDSGYVTNDPDNSNDVPCKKPSITDYNTKIKSNSLPNKKLNSNTDSNYANISYNGYRSDDRYCDTGTNTYDTRHRRLNKNGDLTRHKSELTISKIGSGCHGDKISSISNNKASKVQYRKSWDISQTFTSGQLPPHLKDSAYQYSKSNTQEKSPPCEQKMNTHQSPQCKQKMTSHQPSPQCIQMMNTQQSPQHQQKMNTYKQSPQCKQKMTSHQQSPQCKQTMNTQQSPQYKQKMNAYQKSLQCKQTTNQNQDRNINNSKQPCHNGESKYLHDDKKSIKRDIINTVNYHSPHNTQSSVNKSQHSQSSKFTHHDYENIGDLNREPCDQTNSYNGYMDMDDIAGNNYEIQNFPAIEKNIGGPHDAGVRMEPLKFVESCDLRQSNLHNSIKHCHKPTSEKLSPSNGNAGFINNIMKPSQNSDISPTSAYSATCLGKTVTTPSLYQLTQMFDLIPVKIKLDAIPHWQNCIDFCDILVNLPLSKVTSSKIKETECPTSPQGQYTKLGGPGSAFKPVVAGGEVTTVQFIQVIRASMDIRQVCEGNVFQVEDVVIEVDGKATVGVSQETVQQMFEENCSNFITVTVGRNKLKQETNSLNNITNLLQQPKNTDEMSDLKLQIQKLQLSLKQKEQTVSKLRSQLSWNSVTTSTTLNDLSYDTEINNNVYIGPLGEREYVV